MTQWPHFLRPIKRGQWPSTVWFMAYDQTTAESGLLELTKSDDGYSESGRFLMGRPDLLVPLFRGECLESKEITMISPDAVGLWATYGLWSSAERGYVHIAGTDHRSGSAGNTRDRNATSGLLVCSDPPSILSFRLPPSRTNFLWLDIGNWGVKRPWQEMAVNQTITVLTSWFMSFYEASRLFSLGGLCHTGGSQSLHTFRRHYYTGGVYCHAEQTARSLERGCFRGGRAEAHRVGTQTRNLYYVDIAGAYPFICRTTSVPVRLRRTVSGGGGLSLPDSDQRRGLLARVTV